jgi:hypothetical protein
MFEKIGRLAETAATNVAVSRRSFLGRLGQTALGVAGVLAGLSVATARASSGSYVCCIWRCTVPKRTYRFCYPPGSTCSPLRHPCYVGRDFTQTTVSSCNSCK